MFDIGFIAAFQILTGGSGFFPSSPRPPPSNQSFFFSGPEAPGAPGVEEVYRQPQPHAQPQPGVFRHGEHQGQAD